MGWKQKLKATEGGWAVVTGAGTGIGRNYALQLAELGYGVVVVGNRREPLEDVAAEIRTKGGRSNVVVTDLARMEASEELYAAIQELGVRVDVLINNAGIFSFLDFLDMPVDRVERMILLHDTTLTKNCMAFGRDMACRGRGWIINMSSYSIWMPFPGMSIYTATKAYVRQFSVCLAKELCEKGVRVTAVCPAGVATDLYGLTPYWQRIGMKIGVLMSPASCARRGLRAVARGRRTVVPDWWNRIFIPVCKCLPMWLLRPVRRYTMRFQK